MLKEKSCGCVVFNNNNQVLLVHMNEGHWSFPKGHVEEGESEYETALRETFEETNIRCKIVEGFREVSTYSPKSGVVKDVVFFIGTPINNDIKNQLEEVKSAAYYDISTAKSLLTYENDLIILVKAISYLNIG
jgi:8-oxo-dGTP pyrophosphatase MutT (NUDIX family)